MDFLILILSIILPIIIGFIITFNSDSEIFRVVVILGLIIITFIVVNSFSQHVGLIQSALNLWQSMKTILFVIVLFIIGSFFVFFRPFK